MSNLCEHFYEYFDVIMADEPGLKEEAFKLRYQVYCLENEFEKASDFMDEQESDCYDRHSKHGLVLHRKTGITAATVRLVLHDPDHPDALFPIELNCASSLQSHAAVMKDIPRDSVAEISRFAVSKEFKRRLGEAHSMTGVTPGSEANQDTVIGNRRVLPHLVLGLFAAIVKMSAENGITHWYAVMDRSLLRLLSRFGIDFVPIGGLVDYHGLRQPCYGSVDMVLEGIWRKHPQIWQLITADGTVWPAPETHQRELAGIGC